jgi:serine/threonine protein kinase
VGSEAETAAPNGGAPGDRAMILEAIAQAGRAGSGSDHPGVGANDPPRRIPSGYFPGYDVLGEIHRGGQGVVYRAVQRSTKRVVAIKLMLGGLAGGSSGRARFAREVEVLGQLHHPGIVKVHDSGETAEGGVFYVMDYVGGEPLDAIVRGWRSQAEAARRAMVGSSTDSRSHSRATTLGSGELRRRLEVFAKVCEGVNAAHLRGVIHRDLKPANVRLDESGEPVVVDFGLAKLTEPLSRSGSEDMAAGGDDAGEAPAVTATGQFVGSMPWSSPEQAEGAHDRVDTRSDVYSLGVILYQILTSGRFPYVVIGTMRQVMQNILHAEPERPSSIDRSINDEVETILLKALAKEPERRYQSAGELARDVRRYLAGEPIEAKRDSGWYVLTKTARRHRVPAGFALATAVITLAFTVALGFKYAEADTLRGRAEERAVAEANARTQADIERRRAEENFEAVRDLARTFMFDFADEIEDLRGATRARGLVVDNAAEYLRRLSEQIAGDADPGAELMLELAAAYDRLADLQAANSEANRGETDAAVASLAAASAIRNEVLALSPGRTGVLLDAARGLIARGRVEQRLGRYEEAIATGHEALGLLDRASSRGAAEDEVGPARADARALLGDLHFRLAQSTRDPDAASDSIDRALAEFERAEAWWRPRDDARTEPGEYRNAEGVADLLYRRAQAFGERAILAGRAGDPEADAASMSALEHAVAAVEAFETLRDSFPAARAPARGLVLARLQEGLAWSLLARTATADERRAAALQSLAAYERAQAAAVTLAMDPADLDAQRVLGAVMNRLGNALRDLGRLDEAGLLYDELIAHRRGVYRSDPVARHLRDLGLAIGKRAQIDEKRADLGGPGRDALLRVASAGYREALDVFRELAALGVPADREIAVTERTIARIESDLAGTDDASTAP